MQNLNFEKLVTKTGVPLYVMHLPYANTVAAGVFVKAGSRDEILPHEAGLAHALEHMHFQGTEKFPTSKDVHGYLEEIGGYINAWTSMEGTFYHGQVPAHEHTRLFLLLSEILNKSLFPEQKISIEMKNIVEEIKMNNDNPQSFLFHSGLSFLYKNHPLGKLPLGTESSVVLFKRDDFLRFKETYYDPANYTFVVTGNISSAQALSLFEQYFPNTIAKKRNERLKENISQKETIFIHKRDIQQVNVLLLSALKDANDPSTNAIKMFTTMISGGGSFPLFQEVRDKRGLCYDIQADTDKYSDVSNFSIYIGTDAKRYKEAIDTSIAIVQNNRANTELLEKAKNLRKGRLSLRFENPGGILESAANDLLTQENPRGYDEVLEEIQSITIDDVTRAVSTYLSPEQFRHILLVPESLDIKP